MARVTLTLLHTEIDHIVITAPTLASGVEYVRETLGVEMQPGGEHERMGTHNALLRLGDELYLEVIAANPNAPAPDRPRWFDLDTVTAPALSTWIARTNDIHAATKELSLGTIEPMSRGQFNWLITIPPDGTLPFQGIAPLLIQWLNDSHPAKYLKPSGCSLVKLEGHHRDVATIKDLLQTISFAGDFSVEPAEAPGLIAHIQTPYGRRQLRTP